MTFCKKMDSNKINERLSRLAERNTTLEYLYNLESSVDDSVIENLVVIIGNPDSVDNTNSFATLLVDLNDEDFIPSLIASISKAVPGESKWLADFMYALIELLGELEDYYRAEDSFVHLLGGWMFSTGGGEISWKSSGILSEIQNDATREYYIRGAVDVELFHQTRITCLRGAVNHYQDGVTELLAELITDSDANVSEAARDARAHLTGQKEAEQAGADDAEEAF